MSELRFILFIWFVSVRIGAVILAAYDGKSDEQEQRILQDYERAVLEESQDEVLILSVDLLPVEIHY